MVFFLCHSFLWFSYGFPMVFLWFSDDFLWFPMVFLWFSYGFPVVSYGFLWFPMVINWDCPWRLEIDAGVEDLQGLRTDPMTGDVGTPGAMENVVISCIDD